MSRLAFLVPAAVVCLVVAFPAPACAPVSPPGTTVSVADETALIVWDSRTKTQHFVRRGTFHNHQNVEKFGFLVPVPSRPELKEVDGVLFEHLEKITAPEVVQRKKARRDRYAHTKMSGPVGPGGMGGAPVVTVVDSLRVGNQEYKVLSANDAKALDRWLMENGFLGQSVADWLMPYVAKGWMIVAFKYVRDPADTSGALGTRAVRLSFRADQPYYPYREPLQQQWMRNAKRLRLYVVSSSRVAGTKTKRSWQAGQVVWAKPLDAGARAEILDDLRLKDDAPGEGVWLTEFEDGPAPRQGDDDVLFADVADPQRVSRAQQIEYVNFFPGEKERQITWSVGLLGGVIVTILGGLLLVFRRVPVEP